MKKVDSIDVQIELHCIGMEIKNIELIKSVDFSYIITKGVFKA